MFKEGDLVKVIGRCSGCVPGEIYTLKFKKRLLFAAIKHPSNITVDDGGCSCQDNWILLDDPLRDENENVVRQAIENTIKEINES